MKRIAFFLFGVISIVGCTNEEKLIDNQSETKKIVTTRSLVDSQQASVSNPLLFSDWENVNTVVLNSSAEVTPPWQNGSNTTLPYNFCYDIKKEDGWMMLFHTLKQKGLDVHQNYMCLYNMFTGYLKIFYYYEGENQNQGTHWFVKTTNNQGTDIFNLTQYIAKSRSDKSMQEILMSNLSSSPTTGLNPGWNGFEFEVPYCEIPSSLNLVIGAYNVNVTDFDFTGKSSYSTTGTITSIQTSDKSLVKMSSELLGSDAKKEVDAMVPKIDSLLFKHGNDTTKFGKSKIGTKIRNLIGNIKSISEGNYVDIISKGLNLLFGKSSSSTTQEVSLTTTGTMSFSGTGISKTTTGIPSVSLNLYEVTKRVFGAPKIGVWGSLYGPKLSYKRFTKVTVCERSYRGNNICYIYGKTNSPYYFVSPRIETNSYLSDYIVSSKDNGEMIVCSTLGGEKYKPGVMDMSDRLSQLLLYKDQYKSYYEYIPNIREVDGTMPSVAYSGGLEFYYDWGTILNGRALIVVSREIKYNLNGKEIIVNQSRTYEPEYTIFDEDEDENDYNTGYYRILNYKNAPFNY